MNKKSDYNFDLGKIPPQALDMENAVLGACLLEKEAIEEVINILIPDSFYNYSNQIVFNAIQNLYSQNKPIDILTVSEKLRASKQIENIGGPAYLSNLTSKVASGAHANFHAHIIRQKYIARELIRISSEIQSKSFDESIDVNELIDFAHEQINRASSVNIKKMGAKIGDIGKKRLKQFEDVIKTGVTSFRKLDLMTSGWQPGNFILIAGRPGMGKSRLALELAKKACLNFEEQSVVYFSLEMQDVEHYDRELSSITGIDNMQIRTGKFSSLEWSKIEEAQSEIESMNIIIDDSPALRMNEFKSKARYYKKKHNAGLIIIDYIQLMRYPEFSKFREREISEISGALKQMAKELKIPIIALSQLSREVEKRSDKKPQLSDLRESGSLEQDADTVILIYVPYEYGIEVDDYGNDTKNRIDLIIAKARSGKTGAIRLWKTDSWSEIYENKPDEFENQLNAF